VSSQLSPSRNPLGINAGSHISTLDRLYAWESKLYDEFKVIVILDVLIRLMGVRQTEIEALRADLFCSAFRPTVPSAGSMMRNVGS
jgi:hypothetical protein